MKNSVYFIYVSARCEKSQPAASERDVGLERDQQMAFLAMPQVQLSPLSVGAQLVGRLLLF